MSDHNGPAGHPMDEIAQQFKASTKPSPDQPASEAVSAFVQSDDQSETADTTTSEFESAQTAEAIFGPLSLSPDQIDAPTFFVDKKLSVLWTAPSGTDAFSQTLALELKSASTRNIFNLLLRPAIKGTLSDWQAFFSFVYIMLRRSTTRDTFDTETVFISRNHIPATDNETALRPGIHPFQVDSCIIGRDNDATEPPFRIFGLEFKEGTLFLLRQDLWHPAAAGDREKESADDDIELVDEKESICVLSARLNDSHRIADTMLPEVFFKLMNRIWDEADGVVRSLGGIRAGCSGAQIHYMFTESAGRNPIFSAICCATRLNSRMQALEEKFKAQQGWADDICMNMGISHGKDDRNLDHKKCRCPAA
ncbi:MAG: hypothetical protein HGJ94_17475 [Desulfosarcina sp.]|nr:hypothetical protein [Desulfosarcina sp.]